MTEKLDRINQIINKKLFELKVQLEIKQDRDESVVLKMNALSRSISNFKDYQRKYLELKAEHDKNQQEIYLLVREVDFIINLQNELNPPKYSSSRPKLDPYLLMR